MLLLAGVAVAATGMIWLVLSILSYGAPPQPTLIPVEENSDANSTSNLHAKIPIASFPTLDQVEIAELTKGAVSNSEYGIKLEFVKSNNGYLTGGIGPVNRKGEGSAPEPNALLLSATKVSVYHHRIVICGPDDVCIDNSSGGGPIFAAANETSNTDSTGKQREDHTVFYQFYPLNEVSWNLGDILQIWMLASYSAPDGSAIGELQWVDVGKVAIKECNSQEWCPTT